MKKLKILSGIILVLVFAFVAFLATSKTSMTQDNTEGAKIEDKYPNGCVSCHVNMGEDKDYRISTLLAQHKKHPKVKSLKKIPQDCAKCHREGKKFGALYEVIHKVHYKVGDKNYFLQDLKGNCGMCHAMDTETWKPKVKQGDKNW